MVKHGGQRSIRSIARPLDRVDRFDRFDNFRVFGLSWREAKRRGARDLRVVKVSALHDAWRPKKHQKAKTKIFVFFVKIDSIASIIGSIRSIICSVGVVDRPGNRLRCGDWYMCHMGHPESERPERRFVYQAQKNGSVVEWPRRVVRQQGYVLEVRWIWIKTGFSTPRRQKTNCSVRKRRVVLSGNDESACMETLAWKERIVLFGKKTNSPSGKELILLSGKSELFRQQKKNSFV